MSQGGFAAPKCNYSGCTNHTWNPEGMCHHHVGMSPDASVDKVNGMKESAVPASSADDSDIAREIHSQTQRAFPDISSQVHPQSIREQSVIALRSAVSIDVYRRFPETDVESHETRMSALKQYHHELIERAHISGSDIEDEKASNLSYSSVDQYGRSFDDSVSLASYGVRKEWELAHAMDVKRDEDGVPYGDSYEEYASGISKSFDNAVSDEYMRQLIRYPRIIEEVSGRKPLCSDPIFPDQRTEFGPLQSEPARIPDMYNEPTRTQPEEPRSEGLGDTVKKAGGTALGFIGKKMEEYRQNKPQRDAEARQRRAESQERRQAQMDIKRQREEDELRRLQLRDARRRR